MSKQSGTKRSIFAELMEGVDAMGAHRQGKVTLRTHSLPEAEVKESPGAEFFVAAREKFNVSRAVWADMLRVSPRHGGEVGARRAGESAGCDICRTGLAVSRIRLTCRVAGRCQSVVFVGPTPAAKKKTRVEGATNLQSMTPASDSSMELDGTQPTRNLSGRCRGAELLPRSRADAPDAARGKPGDSQAGSGGGRNAV